jgi:hypothetical protein
MKGLDGIQGPIYVGNGCVFRRQALYGYDAPKIKRRRHHQELATAGPSDASLAAAAGTRIKRRLQNQRQRRRNDYFSRKQKTLLLHMLWVKLRKVLQVLTLRRLEL